MPPRDSRPPRRSLPPAVSNRKSGSSSKRKKKSGGLPTGVIAGVVGVAVLVGIVVIAWNSFRGTGTAPAAVSEAPPPVNSPSTSSPSSAATTAHPTPVTGEVAPAAGRPAAAEAPATTGLTSTADVPGSAPTAAPAQTKAVAEPEQKPPRGMVPNTTGALSQPTPEMAAMERKGFMRQMQSSKWSLTNEGVDHWYSIQVTFTDADLPLLKPFPNLEVLDIPGADFSDQGAVQLAEMFPGLKQLNLDRTRITDGGLKALAVLGALEELELSQTAVTDRGLKTISESFPNLKMLAINETRVTDKGLKALANLKNLKTVKAKKSKVTKAGSDALRKELPACVVTVE